VPWTAPGSSWSRASPRSRREGSRWAWADIWRPGATPSTIPSSAREIAETGTKPAAEAAEVTHILRSFGLAAEESAPIVAALRKRPEAWVDFMMRFELGLEKPDPRRALSSALTIGGAYVAGGFIPLAPYMALASAPVALMASVVVTVVALGLFGWIKGRFTGLVPLRSAFQTMLIGGAAAAAAFAIARAIT